MMIETPMKFCGIWRWSESLRICNVFDDDDRTPYESTWYLSIMNIIPMRLFGLCRWWTESTESQWIYILFVDDDVNPWIHTIFDDDDRTPYEFIWYLSVMIRTPMDSSGFCRWWSESLGIPRIFRCWFSTIRLILLGFIRLTAESVAHDTSGVQNLGRQLFLLGEVIPKPKENSPKLVKNKNLCEKKRSKVGVHVFFSMKNVLKHNSENTQRHRLCIKELYIFLLKSNLCPNLQKRLKKETAGNG